MSVQLSTCSTGPAYSSTGPDALRSNLRSDDQFRFGLRNYSDPGSDNCLEQPRQHQRTVDVDGSTASNDGNVSKVRSHLAPRSFVLQTVRDTRLRPQ
eukprot:2966960-Pyramimonas_sp.AAC.1